MKMNIIYLSFDFHTEDRKRVAFEVEYDDCYDYSMNFTIDNLHVKIHPDRKGLEMIRDEINNVLEKEKELMPR